MADEEQSALLIDEKTLPADVELDLQQELLGLQLRDDDLAGTSSTQGRLGVLQVAGSTDCLNISAGGSEDATPVARRTMSRAVHTSMPDLSFAGRRHQYSSSGRATTVKPMSMREYDQTLTRLRKENWNLKLKIFLMDKNMPKFVGVSGEDVIKMNIDLTVEVETLRKEKQEDEERFHQLSNDLTAMRQTGQQEIDSLCNENDRLRKQFDDQVEENRKVQRSLLDAKQRATDLEAELRYAKENLNCSDSEAASSISIVSDRDRRILDLQSAVVSKECDARDLQRNYEERIEELQQLLARCAPQNISLSDRNRTPRRDETLEQTLVESGSLAIASETAELIRDLQTRVANKDVMITALQRDLDHARNGAQTDIQSLDNDIAQLQSALDAAQKEIKLRDKAIQGLLLAQSKKANAEKNMSKKQLETEVAVATEMRDLLRSEIDDRLAVEANASEVKRMHDGISRLRADLDRLTTENTELQQQLQAVEAAADSTASANLSQLAEFAQQSDNINRIMRDRLNMMVNKVGDESLMKRLVALNETRRVGSGNQSGFAASPSTAQVQSAAHAVHVEQSTTTPGGRRVSFQMDMIDFTSATELYNRTLNTTQDLNGLKDKLYLLRKICDQLFRKLKGSADFLKGLLEQLGGGDLAKQFIDGFESFQFDLDASLRHAHSLLEDVQTAEKSIAELVVTNERRRTADLSAITAHLEVDYKQLEDNNKQLETENNELKRRLDENDGAIRLASQEIASLQKDGVRQSEALRVAEERITEEQSKRESDAEQHAKERQRLSDVARQLETHNKELKVLNKELKRRLDDSDNALRLADQERAEKQQECARLSDALRLAEQSKQQFEAAQTNDRRRVADLSATVRKLEIENKELSLRLDDNNEAIRLAHQQIDEKQQQCTRLSEAVRVTEQRLAEEQSKRQSVAAQAKDLSDQERQRFVDLSAIAGQLEIDNKELKANFKELRRRLDDNKNVIRLSKEQIAEKQKECDRLTEALHLAERRIVEGAQASERQRTADLSQITRQLEVNNKELKQRLDDNNDVIRVANQQIAEKHQECIRLTEALRAAEHRLVELQSKRQPIPISPSTSSSSLEAAQKSSLPEADMGTPSEVSPNGGRRGGSSDQLKQELHDADRRLRRVLKLIKAMSDAATSLKSADWKQLDEEVKALRYTLDLCAHLTSSSKENVAPADGHVGQFETNKLKAENEQLREHLVSLQHLLQDAQLRLQAQPAGISSAVNDGIIRELTKIRHVLKATRQDYGNAKKQPKRGGGPRT